MERSLPQNDIPEEVNGLLKFPVGELNQEGPIKKLTGNESVELRKLFNPKPELYPVLIKLKRSYKCKIRFYDVKHRN